MLDMGWAEIGTLFVLALLIFGPDKLPKLATDAAAMLRKLRELAQSAQSGLSEQGVDIQGIKTDLQSVAELHPKRIVGSVMSDLNEATSVVTAAATPTATDSSTETAAANTPESASPATTSGDADKSVKVVTSSTVIDPDAT